MTAALCTTVALLLGATGCTAPTDEEVASDEARIQEDMNRAPTVVWVPVRFTRNSVEDVGWVFGESWLPFTSPAAEKLDAFSWGYTAGTSARNMSTWYQPDQPGAGYATAWFKVEVPYDTEGKHAYALARVNMAQDFMKTEIAWRATTTFSPLRVRSGSDQPCRSITMAGALEGKFRAMGLPFTDTDFTERDWKAGEKDASGKPIVKVAVGTLNFQAVGWPENVEGKTNISGGVAAGNAFVMVDKQGGQAQSGFAKIHVNLVENDAGEISVGATFSTNGGVLNAREKAAFDAAAIKFREEWDRETRRGTDAINEAWARQGEMTYFPP